MPGLSARGIVFVVRVLLLAAVLVGCANVAPDVAPDVATVDAGEDAFEPVPRETSPEPWPDGSAAAAPADAAALDAAACTSRPSACGDTWLEPLADLLWRCTNMYWSCGDVHFAIDNDGCATAIAFDREHTKPEFEACVIAELLTHRYPCVAPGTVRRPLSCTVK